MTTKTNMDFFNQNETCYLFRAIEPSPSVDDELRASFDKIIEEAKTNQLQLNDIPTRERYFEDHLLDFQKRCSDRDRSLLHYLAYDILCNTPDCKQLIMGIAARCPEMMQEQNKDIDDRTPLHAAIIRQNYRWIWWSLGGDSTPMEAPELCKIIGAESDGVGTCLHAAIKYLNPVGEQYPSILKFLIDSSELWVLRCRDGDKLTPLHLAVDFRRCTKEQLSIVQALLQKYDGADQVDLDCEGYISPFEYHQASRPEAQNTLKQGTGSHAGQGRGARSEFATDIKASKVKLLQTPDRDENRRHVLDKSSGSFPGLHISGEDLVRRSIPTSVGRPSTQAIAPDIAKISIPGNTDLIIAEQRAAKARDSPDRSNPRPGKVLEKNSNSDSATTARCRVSIECANDIREVLQMHYLRTKTSKQATRILYGKNIEGRLVDFNFYNAPENIDAQQFRKSFHHVILADCLKSVTIPCILVQPEMPSADTRTDNSQCEESDEHNDACFFFDWLRSKRVRRIIHVVVEDRHATRAAHDDDAIDKALNGFCVETLDWRKMDLSPEVITKNCPALKELYLYWSGSNAVLRGWSDESEKKNGDEKSGLGALTKLATIHLTLQKGVKKTLRHETNVIIFQKRLQDALCRDITLHFHVEEPVRDPKPTTGPSPVNVEIEPHKWIKCMDQFADAISNLKMPDYTGESLPEELKKEIMIAIIDDGVDTLQQSICDKVVRGWQASSTSPYWFSETGHGTAMASFILEVFPKAKLYICSLESRCTSMPDGNQKLSFEPRSAIEAIKSATDFGVDIISMSWTIQSEMCDEKTEIDLRQAIVAAADKHILMFCADDDCGPSPNTSLPVSVAGNMVTLIGAADATGSAGRRTGSVDFLVPGEKVMLNSDYYKGGKYECVGRPLTGSSVATALASGLAGLILHCARLSAIHAHKCSGTTDSTSLRLDVGDYKSLKSRQKMHKAFSNIGTSTINTNQNPFIMVWNTFPQGGDRIQDALDRDAQERSWDEVDNLVRNIVKKPAATASIL